jgi:hypothetical protein
MLTALTLLASPALAADVTFPRARSLICDEVNPPAALGAGGGAVLSLNGNKIQDKYLTGLASVSSLDLSFSIDDQTTAGCAVGILDFHVEVNGVNVGGFSFQGGNQQGAIAINQNYVFAPIAGGGPGDGFKIRVIADDAVCNGGGGYNYLPGGLASLN